MPVFHLRSHVGQVKSNDSKFDHSKRVLLFVVKREDVTWL
jgi:hypothetical protein